MRRLALVAVVGAVLAGGAAPAPAATPAVSITTLSNRADLISGGDAFVAIDLAEGVDPADLRVSLGQRDITAAFAPREAAGGRIEGLVEGLKLGTNVLTARLPDGSAAKLTITNHPNGGPVFSGPQIQPWTCQATAVDTQCNQPAAYELQYRSTDGSMKAYDPANPPSDVDTTTTDQGVTVPFIVRFETGYQDRDQYKIAVLYDPKQAWAPWAPQGQWNHKLVITHGSGCGNHYMVEEAPSVTGFGGIDALARGFAVLSTTLDNAGGNCNVVTQAESLMMAKERLVEQYGPLRYTIGTGCSGGSLTQQQVANAYPGIYQGIIPQCSFPDAWTTGQQVNDYHLLRLYTENPAKWEPGVLWTPAEIAAVEGHPNHANAIEFDQLFWTSFFNPSSNQYTTLGVPGGCYSAAGDPYEPETKPGGVRCTMQDFMVNVFGPRPQEVWTAPEQKLGAGFAGRALDNVGVQYGLQALEGGQISPAQFVDLNAKIGGVDIDGKPIPGRLGADQPALRYAYRSGAVNTASNLDQVPIIDVRAPDYGTFHDAFRSWATRARLQRQQGHFRNHVIWFDSETQSDHSFSVEALVAMDRWLAAIEADDSDAPLASKIVSDRPSDLQDRCTSRKAAQLCDVPAVKSLYGTPRTIAGESIATDTQKCALRPPQRSDYHPILFSDAQWARLQQAFPSGVCDWNRPGPDQADTIPWLGYQKAAGHVVYGGRPLGPPPHSVAPGANS